MLGVVDEALTSAAGHAAWIEPFNEMFAQVAGVFAEAPSRRRARAYLLGLLSQAERKNGWTIAEFAGDLSRWRVFADPAGHPFCLLQHR